MLLNFLKHNIHTAVHSLDTVLQDAKGIAKFGIEFLAIGCHGQQKQIGFLIYLRIFFGVKV